MLVTILVSVAGSVTNFKCLFRLFISYKNLFNGMLGKFSVKSLFRAKNAYKCMYGHIFTSDWLINPVIKKALPLSVTKCSLLCHVKGFVIVVSTYTYVVFLFMHTKTKVLGNVSSFCLDIGQCKLISLIMHSWITWLPKHYVIGAGNGNTKFILLHNIYRYIITTVLAQTTYLCWH